MNKTKRLLALSFLVLFMNSCAKLTPLQTFERDFPNKVESSITIDELLKSPQSLNIDKNYYGVLSYFDPHKPSDPLKVYTKIPQDYKVEKIWFIYFIDFPDIYNPNYKLSDKKHLYISETDTIPAQETNIANSKYYAFYNVSNFIRVVVVRLKKGSQVSYLRSFVSFNQKEFY